MSLARPNFFVVCLALAAACLAGAPAASAQEKVAEDETARQTRIARELIEVTQAYVVYKIGDFDAAFAAWMALAEKGNSQGMLNVGNMYLAGEGTEKDPEAAFGWYRKAADAGSSIGLHQVAESYALGRGVARDEATARAYYECAAKAGSAEAQLWLGEKLAREGDATQGKAWLDKAAAQGDMRARDILAALSPVYANTARPAHPLARDRVIALLAQIDAAANARNAAGFAVTIAPDARIAVDMPVPGGREKRTMSPEEYKALWRETFARLDAYSFSRSGIEIDASNDGVIARSEIIETFGGGPKLELKESLLIDLSGQAPRIVQVSLVVGAPGVSPEGTLTRHDERKIP